MNDRADNDRIDTFDELRAGESAAPRGLRDLTRAISHQESDLRRGGGDAGQDRQRKLGRLPVRERLLRLLDHEAPFIETGLWAAWGMYPEVGEVPAAGVVTGVGRIAG